MAIFVSVLMSIKQKDTHKGIRSLWTLIAAGIQTEIKFLEMQCAKIGGMTKDVECPITNNAMMIV